MRDYLSAAGKTPPGVLLALARKKLFQAGARWTRRTQLRFGPASLSDDDLFRALVDIDDAESLVARLRGGRRSVSLIDASERQPLVQNLRRRYPDELSSIVRRADLAMEHVFDLLGSGPVALGPDIDWCRDFKSGYRWPDGFHADLVQIDLDTDADVKVPRELSRFHHAVTLAQAYWCTGDERYAREVIAQQRDWIADNPPRMTINWGSAMDVAIRLVNWIWAYWLLVDSPALDDDWHVEFLKSVKQHADFVVENLEYLGVFSNNHYVADLAGLAIAGITFPEFKSAARWRRIGLAGLEAEIVNQVHADGSHFEGSFGYHRAVTETWATVALLAARNGIALSRPTLERLEKMFELILHYTMPDGRAPQFGDADDGGLQFLGEFDPADHRGILALGAVLFDRADFARAAGVQPAAVWLLGPAGVEKLEALAAAPAGNGASLPSRAFPDGGFYFGRSPGAHLAINCSPTGRRGRGSHSHNDALSFQLHAFGRLWLADPGTYTYTADWMERNRFRATAAHNTLMVDEEEINRFDPRQLFRLADDAEIEVRRWRSTDDFDLLDAEHDGYLRLPDPVVHRRQFYLDKARTLLVVRDLVAGAEAHELSWSFHFAPGLDLQDADIVVEATPRSANPGGCGLLLSAVGEAELSLEVIDDWFSPRFGVRVPAKTARYTTRCKLPVEVTFVVAPYAGGRRPKPGELRRTAADAPRSASA